MSLGPVADVLVVAVDEQVGGGPVDELEPLHRHRRPVVGGDPLPHDPARDRDELEVDVGDALVDDPPPDLPDQVVAAVLSKEALQCAGHQGSLSAVSGNRVYRQ